MEGQGAQLTFFLVLFFIGDGDETLPQHELYTQKQEVEAGAAASLPWPVSLPQTLVGQLVPCPPLSLAAAPCLKGALLAGVKVRS